MIKYLSICAALVALGAGAAKAQDREAVFQKVTVPGASFDMILAVAKPGSPVVYYWDQPDPNIIYLGNGLVTAYTAELAAILDIATLMRPAYTFAAMPGNEKSRTPMVIYIVPKATTPAAATMR